MLGKFQIKNILRNNKASTQFHPFKRKGFELAFQKGPTKLLFVYAPKANQEPKAREHQNQRGSNHERWPLIEDRAWYHSKCNRTMRSRRLPLTLAILAQGSAAKSIRRRKDETQHTVDRRPRRERELQTVPSSLLVSSFAAIYPSLEYCIHMQTHTFRSLCVFFNWMKIDQESRNKAILHTKSTTLHIKPPNRWIWP